MGVFLPKYPSSDVAERAVSDVSNLQEWNQSLHNDSMIHEDYQTQSEKVSQRMITNATKGERIELDNIQDPQKGSSIVMGKEKNKNDRSEWESLWRHYGPVDSNKTQDVTIEERKQMWKQILNRTLQSNTTEESVALSDLYTAFPLPQDSVQYYNEDAYNSLVSSILDAQREGRNFTIVASGGSATAGGGDPSIPQRHRYYTKFADQLNALLSKNDPTARNPTVQWIGQGHGFRTSLHTALFFDTFIPEDADLLLWEFSINDALPILKDEELIMTSARNNLLSWLYQVKRMKRPAKVILIYKWDAVFGVDEKTNRTICHVFEAHGNAARQFDFVVGHVHVGHYIDELALPECRKHQSCPLLGDRCHVNPVGHLAISFLLMELMRKPNVQSRPSQTENTSIVDSPDYRWECGNQTEVKRALIESMTTTTNSSVEWRSPVGSWTSELPAIENQVTPRRLVPGPAFGASKLMGKQDPNREDRQQTTPIYRCDMNESNSFSLIAPVEPMVDVRVVLLNFRIHPIIKTGSISFRVNGSNTTVAGQLVPLRAQIRKKIVQDWLCSLPFPWGTTLDIYVFLFDEIQASVRSMEICAVSKFTRMPEIQSVTLW